MNAESHRIVRRIATANLVVAVVLAVYFLIVPGFLVVWNVADPAMREPGIPRMAWRLHRDLTPRLRIWAERRMASGDAGHLQLHDVPSTEWPIFSCVFYLWATESLQDAWTHHPVGTAPRDYARKTVDAAVNLVLDPVHHTWVKTHWGPNYMHRENVFFRSLVIAALTSHYRLTGETAHLEVLKDQLDTLSAELDVSPHGVLNDYPDECYPIDVLAAIAWIHRADEAVGTDHSAFVARAVRGFEGAMLDERGLIPYCADPNTGSQYQTSRGVGNSHVSIYAPALWPDRARAWYAAYEKYFWQERLLCAGFREFPKGLPGYEWTYDVDAGPIIAGFSPAANAFGLAAARVNGRFDHAFTLASQVIPATWPLPGGGLLGTRLLSNPYHAPYLGETALLYFLTRTPAAGMPVRTGGTRPGFYYAWLVFFFLGGILVIWSSASAWRKKRRNEALMRTPAARVQGCVWMILAATSVALMLFHWPGPGLICLLATQFLPFAVKDAATNRRMLAILDGTLGSHGRSKSESAARGLPP